MRNWVDSAKNRDYWRALVNVVFNIWVPKAMELVSYDLNNSHLVLHMETDS